MEANQYSEQDIQDYAAGKFNGDISNFEAYMKKYPAISDQVKKYQDLFSLLNDEETLPSLSFNLADKVIAKIQQQEYKREAPKFNLLPYVLMLITVFAFFITSQYLDVKQIFSSSVYMLFLTSAAAMILFFVGFYFVEIKQVQKRFAC